MSERAGRGIEVVFTAPEDWFELDVDPTTSEASLDDLLRSRVAGANLDPTTVASIEAELRFVLGKCQEIGALAAMGFADIIDEPPYLLAAGLILTMVDTGTDDVDAATVQRELGLRGRDVEPTVLPAGPALRSVTQTSELAPGVDEPIDVLQVKYYVPTAGAIALLAFSTPTTELADEFLDLFEAIAETLEFS
jgi:hypothetical protein